MGRKPKDDKPIPPKSAEQLAAEAAAENTNQPPPGTDQGNTQTEIVKRTRKRRETVPDEPPPEIPIQAYEIAFKVPFNIVGMIRKCPTWALTDEEAKQLAEYCKPAIDYYLIPYIGKHFIGISAISALIGIVIAKAQAEETYRAQQKDKGESKPAEKTE